MPPPKRYEAYASFVFDAEDEAAIKRLAEQDDVPPAVIYRRLIKRGLRSLERAEKRQQEKGGE